MKRLIIDHYRRWRWVLGLVALFQIGVGSHIALNPTDNFEFWTLMVALWGGANLLQFDFQRGLMRGLAALPVTQQQIGRAWWTATVFIPGIIFPALLFLGAGISWLFGHGFPVPTGRLAMAGVFSILWLGIISTAPFSGWGFRRGNSFNFRPADLLGYVSSITLLGGMIYFQDASKSPFKLWLFVSLGVILTVVGWFKANSFTFADMLGVSASKPAARQGGTHKTSLGNGGLLYLFQTTTLRTFRFVLSMAAILIFFVGMQGRLGKAPGVQTLLAPGSLFLPIFLVMLAVMPYAGQVRFWRTLPLSATRLAATLLGLTMLPAFCLSILLTTTSLIAFGSHAAVLVMETSLISLAPFAVGTCFMIWQGGGRTAASAIFAMGMVFATFLPEMVLHGEIPWVWASAGTLGCIGASFFVARKLLSNSSHVYRVRPLFGTAFGSPPFSSGR